MVLVKTKSDLAARREDPFTPSCYFPLLPHPHPHLHSGKPLGGDQTLRLLVLTALLTVPSSL